MMAYEDEDLGTLPERENGTILLRQFLEFPVGTRTGDVSSRLRQE
jgi:hypothetical protein